MKFIRDYRQFIEVSCTSCNRKHTIQFNDYKISSEGYVFESPINCPCGHIANTAIKDKRAWIIKSEKNEMLKRNKATTIKLWLVMGFTIVFFASELFFMLSTKETEQKSAHHEAETEASSLFEMYKTFEYNAD